MKIKAAGYLLLNCFGALLISISGCEETVESGVVDIDGNIYGTVVIGTQVWMTENLRTTRLNDGTKILLVADDTAWSNLTTPGYCWYGNYEAFFSLNHFGALYNGYAARTEKLCPVLLHFREVSGMLIMRTIRNSDTRPVSGQNHQVIHSSSPTMIPIPPELLRGLRMTEFLYDVSRTRMPRPQTILLKTTLYAHLCNVFINKMLTINFFVTTDSWYRG